MTNGQRSTKWNQRGILNPRYFTQHCFYRGSDIEGISECRPGTKSMSFSSISQQNGSPRGQLKHTPHITRKTKHQNTEFLSKSGICRKWPHLAMCGQAPGGAHPHVVYKLEPDPYNPGRGRKHRNNNKKLIIFRDRNVFGLGDLAAPRDTSDAITQRGVPGLARRDMSQSIHVKHPRGTSCGVSTGYKGIPCGVSTTDDVTKINSTKTLLKCMMNAYTLSRVVNVRQKVQTKGTTHYGTTTSNSQGPELIGAEATIPLNLN